MIRFFTTLVLLLSATLTFAQKPVFQGNYQATEPFTELSDQFTAWEVFQIDVQAMNGFVTNAGDNSEFTLEIGEHQWDVSLQKRDLRSPSYISTVLTDEGTKTLANGQTMTYRGYHQNEAGWSVALTMDNEFLYGYIQEGYSTYYIEPLWYFVPGQPEDLFVVYAAADVKPNPDKKCGLETMVEKMEELLPEDMKGDIHDDVAEKMMACKEIELAIAADLSMYNAFGSVPAVNAFTFGVMNNVQTNYDDEFNDELQFEIVEQFVVAPPASDPWTNSNDAGTLLNSFTNWGPSGFSANHDIGQLWTDRNLSGGTVGIAWLCAVCNSNRYHVVSNFTTNATFLRVMTAHEIGHNFCAQHDAPNSGFIMQPSVGSSNTWSSASQTAINGYYPGRWCLGTCSSSQPPAAGFTGTPTTGCAPLSVAFTDQSTNGPISWNWTFPGGTPGTSSQQDPTVVYNSAGVYDVSLTVTNLAGSNSITQNDYITVQTVPVPGFTWTQVGLTLIFNNTSSPNATSFLWNFGDGNTSTATNPTHTYGIDGFYDVTLTAINACGSVPMIVTIPVYVAPTANFQANPTSGCAALNVNFVDTSSPNVTAWSWNFPGANPSSSTLQFPSTLYSAPGLYSVTLTVSNPAGVDIEAKTGYITVGTIPTPGFTSSVNGSTVTFTNTTNNSNGIGAVTYLWSFGDGNTSTATNPVHTYTAGGSYGVVLTATNTCGSAAITQAVTIVLPPTAGFSANNTSGCAPLSVQFNNLSTGATGYNWSFPGGTPSSSTTQNPLVQYNTAGTYSVTLIVTNSAGSDTLTQTDYIVVNTVPAAGFTSSINGLNASFTNTSTNATSYLWNFGDGNTSTATNPTHTYAADGTYTVTLEATNVCGTVTTTQTVTIVTPPSANFSANNTSGCAPLTVQFNNLSSPNSTSFNWTFPGGSPGTSTAQNPTVTYSTPGTYNVTLIVGNAAGSDTTTLTNYITVNTVPSAGFTSTTNGFNASFTNTSTNATSYAWNFGDGGTSTATNPTHTYAADGTYTVILSATNTCGTVTSTQTVTIVTPPSAGFSATNTSGCGPLTVQYNNLSSSNATSFNWTFPGGSPGTSTAEDPTVTYSTPGSYNVTLIASNSAGNDTTTLTNYITVQAPPAAGFTVATNVFVANFTNTTTNGTSYAWNFGDGDTSTATNPTHTYPGDGTYTVTLTATGPCGTNTTTQQVVISSLPVAGFSAPQTEGCTPFTVQFQDQSSSNTTGWNWSFPGGTPSSSTAQNPSVTYSTPGTYNVSLTASNPLGQNTATQTNYITVGTTPTAGFTSTTNLLTANFTNTSTNATSYAWNFGDGGTSTQANPSHTYATDGTYTVTLTATNDCGSVVFTQTVTVATPPSAGFTASNTAGCAPLTVQFTNQSSANATTFAWSFPGGTPSSSSAENPTVVYNSAGTYTVTLTVSNAAGQSTATQANLITVSTVPSVTFSGTVAGTTVSFTNNTTNPNGAGTTSYLWEFGDGGTSTETNPAHTYPGDGVYEVTLTATNDCGSVSVNGQFTIVTPPTAGFSAAQTGGCAPFQVHFTNESSANATSFAWTFPGGTPASSTDENPLVTYSTPGIYDVTLTVSNAAGNDTYTLTNYIVVSGGPVAGFTSSVIGAAATFTNNSSNATSYLWDFGDGNTSTEANPIHLYQADGAYDVILTATNECGSVTTTGLVVIATQGPIAAFTAENTTGCAPLTVQFTNLSSANSETFLWSFPGGTPFTSNQENPTVTYASAGVYDVTLTVTNAQGNNTATETSFVTVLDKPAPDFSFNSNFNIVTFTNTTTGATSYEWDFGDGNTSTEENPVHTYQTGGSYEVTLTATNECGFRSMTVEITVMANGVEDLPGISRFSVYPNPNGGRFTLLLEGAPQDELELTFTNVLGQQLLSEKADFRAGHLTKEFSFGDLAAGTYFLQVKSGDKSLFKKVVVE